MYGTNFQYFVLFYVQLYSRELYGLIMESPVGRNGCGFGVPPERPFPFNWPNLVGIVGYHPSVSLLVILIS